MQKENGITRISLSDIAEALNLPAEQVENTLEKLFEKGVKEVN